MDDLISRLSEIRSNYNCFDETEEPYYRALSEAIQLVSAQPERTGRKMTNAEAIETLIANYPDACFEQLREAVDAAIEALKAQPETIRPYIKTMFQPFPYCPKCNHYLITGDNYCSVCGRHIDWSEDDDTAD